MITSPSGIFRALSLSAGFALWVGSALHAQAAPDTALSKDTGLDSAFEAMMAGDSAEQAAPPQPAALLPARLGPMESFMWSEHGLMRKTFNLPLTPEERHKELEVRRNMLGLHQIGGFATLAALIATVTLGQLTYNGHQQYAAMHIPMAYTAITMYFTTASLAIFTPPPAIRRGEWSTVSTHKMLATVHFTGMILTPILGTFAHDNRQVATVHLTSAYITTAAFAGAMIAVTF